MHPAAANWSEWSTVQNTPQQAATASSGMMRSGSSAAYSSSGVTMQKIPHQTQTSSYMPAG